MGNGRGALHECSNCGRTFNTRINNHCPACEADIRCEEGV